jgi:hypothetical protein
MKPSPLGRVYFRRITVANAACWVTVLLWVETVCMAALVTGTTARGEEFEAMSARVSPDYGRKKGADGSFVPESYAFAKGGYWSGPIFDKTIDKMEFLDIARIISVPLASQNYWPTSDQQNTQLLLVVYWGTTYAPEHASESNAYNLAQQKAADEHGSNQRLIDAELAEGGKASTSTQPAGSASDVRIAKTLEAQDSDAMSSSLAVVQSENQTRDQANFRNAVMLGYDSEWSEVMGGLSGPAQDFKRSKMISELEEARYFVVVMAYDYQLLTKQKKHKLLWETRYSIRQRTHAFDQQLASMTLQASKFFGQDSNGLTHKPLPEGHVEIGGVRNLGDVPEDQVKQGSPAPSKWWLGVLGDGANALSLATLSQRSRWMHCALGIDDWLLSTLAALWRLQGQHPTRPP